MPVQSLRARPSSARRSKRTQLLRRADGSPLRTLIVEDDPTAALDLLAIVAGLGGAAKLAATVGEARRAADSTRPELVLIDIRLPDGDGVSLAGEIRGRFASAIVFVTGSTDPKTLTRVEQVGQFPVVRKPLTVFGLTKAVIAAVGNRDT